MLNKLSLELVPQELYGRELESKAVENRLCRATLSFRVHKQACKRVAAQVGAMFSSITLIHSSPLIFRPGSTKGNVGAMSRAPMMPETITPRVVAVCDAVNRSSVSSSSSASIFEVLRDS